MTLVALRVDRVLELRGAFREAFGFVNPAAIYAFVCNPVRGMEEAPGEKRTAFEDAPYAFLAPAPQQGEISLGEIDPKTMMFVPYYSTGAEKALYLWAQNHIVDRVIVRPEQLGRLKRLDDVIAISGISVANELIPKH